MHPSDTKSETCIVTARLTLRPPLADDIADCVAQLNELDVARMLARVPHPYSRRDAEAFLARVIADHAAGNDLHLAILRDERAIGGIALHDIAGRAEVGYWLGRGYWGNGYATEALVALMRHAFDALGRTSVTSGAFADNPASLRVQEKVGFMRIGTSRVHCLARGQCLEHVDTRLTAQQFRELWP